MWWCKGHQSKASSSSFSTWWRFAHLFASPVVILLISAITFGLGENNNNAWRTIKKTHTKTNKSLSSKIHLLLTKITSKQKTYQYKLRRKYRVCWKINDLKNSRLVYELLSSWEHILRFSSSAQITSKLIWRCWFEIIMYIWLEDAILSFCWGRIMWFQRVTIVCLPHCT